jgi:spore coat polysaccharide biosynthesis protein SpsF (cytidylyltransferase family)
MNTVAIVQARMGSTRLPGKVMMPLAGIPVLGHVVDRLSYCKTLESTVVATTTETNDDAVEEFCEQRGIAVFRGSEQDVLDRYHQAAVLFDADPVVRITADCPAIDPVIVDRVVAGYLEGDYDLFGLMGEFPDGLDCTVFARSALDRAWAEAKLASEREHVGPYIQDHPELFTTGGIELFEAQGHQRWTLDEPEDYELLTVIFEALYRPGDPFLSGEVIEFLEQHPELLEINNNVTRNEGYITSLENDEVIG